LRILIVSGAGGGTSRGSVGKYYHLKDFGEALTKFGVKYKLIRETDYVVGFPTKQLRKYFSSKKKFQKLISEFKPDAVLVDRQSDFGLQIIKIGIPLFVLLRGNHWSEIQYAKDTIYRDKIMQKVLDIRADVAEQVFAGATVVLPICKYLIDIVKEHHPTQKMDVFVEGVDNSKWYEKEGMSLQHPCVGLLQDANWWRKTREMLVLENVIKSMPDVNFYWAGDGQYKDKVLEVLDKFDNFHWLGSLEYPNKVREYLTEIDIYAIITGMDTTPLSLKEAQLMKRPVIATNVGGNSETMKDGETGFLVKEGDDNDIIEKISLLLKDKELSQRLGQQGCNFIEKEFSLEASAKNFLKIVTPYVKDKN
tara:strand:+ start:12597 stop:13688 length:1092 start_codon:yes stop_codon:yes gene_type:complete